MRQRADALVKDKNGRTPLHWAAQEGKTEVAQLLIANQADLEAKDKDGWTPLHFAAMEGMTEVAQLLLAQKADVGARDVEGRTPLHTATQEGKTEVANLLLQQKADVEARDRNGWTPLHTASYFEYQEIAELLLQHQADPLAKNEMGYVETAKLLKSEQRLGCRSSQGQNLLPDMSCTRRWTKGVDSLRRLSVEFFKKSTVDYLDQKEEADRSYQRMEAAIKKLMLNITQQPMLLSEVEQSYFNALKLLVTFSHRLGGAAVQNLLKITTAFVEQYDASVLLRTRYDARFCRRDGLPNLKGLEWIFCFADDDWLGGGEKYPCATSKDGKKIRWSPEADIYCLRLHIDEGLVEESWPTQPEEPA